MAEVNVNKITLSSRSLTKIVSATLICSTSSLAMAGEDTTPFSVTLSHDILRDSNYSRNEAKESETVNTTTARFGFNKLYGRQAYRGAAQLGMSRFANNSELNNDGKNLSGAFSTGIASNWIFSTNANYSENLNPIQDNLANNRVVRNIRKYRDGGASLQYGRDGLWSLVGAYDANRLNYSEATYQYQNANQTSTSLQAYYYSTDVLRYGLGSSLVKTKYPINRNDEIITDRNINFSTNWQITGLSSLDATLTRRNSSYASDSTRKLNGWTGALDWSYTPRGLVTYGLGISRTTGTDRRTDLGTDAQQTLDDRSISDNNVTTAYNLSMAVALTGKLTFNIRQYIARYKVANIQDGTIFTNGQDQSRQTGSIYHNFQLGLNYQVLRSFGLGCSWQRYSQTLDVLGGRPKYEGHSIGCNANFTID